MFPEIDASSDVKLSKKRKHEKDADIAVDLTSEKSHKKDKKKRKEQADAAAEAVPEEQIATEDKPSKKEKKEKKHKKKREQLGEEELSVNVETPEEPTKKEKKDKKRKSKEGLEEDASGSSKKERKEKKPKTDGAAETPIASSSRAVGSVPSSSEVEEFLTKHSITIHSASPIVPIVAFDQLDVPDSLRASCDKFKEPTPIQACTWPPSLAGLDVVGIAETGR